MSSADGHIRLRPVIEAVNDAVARLEDALVSDDIVLGGGNAKTLKTIRAGTKLGDNADAFIGGQRLWNEAWLRDVGQ